MQMPTVADLLTSLLVFVIGTIFLILIVLTVIDVSRTKYAIRKNFPVIDRLRTVFERLGEFFRQ